jgi:predicted nucleotidyltransferase
LARSSSGSSSARSKATPVADASADEELGADVVGICRDVLGDALIGAYLHGSAVLGGLRPTSDLDVLAVVARPTTAAERRSIVERLLRASGRHPRADSPRPVELTIVQQSELRPWRPAPTVELLYGEWRRDEFERGEIPDPGPMPDLAPEIVLALSGNRVVFGPPPAEVMAPVPTGGLRAAMVAGVPSLLADLETDTRNVLLTLARIVATLETGEIQSKDAAVDLVAHRLPAGGARDVLLLARDMYRAGIGDDEGGAGWAAMRPAAREAAAELVSEIAGYDAG